MGIPPFSWHYYTLTGYGVEKISMQMNQGKKGNNLRVAFMILCRCRSCSGLSAVAGTAASIWILFGLYGVLMGLTEGIQKGFLATIIPPDFKATAFGVYATFVGLATLPASLIGGVLWDRISPAATFYFGSATATVASILFMILIALDRNPASS